MLFIEKAVYILGIPVALVCTDSLFLVLLGIVQPDPHPSTWLSMYITDCLFGLALFYQLYGYWRRKKGNRLMTAALGGYSFFSFGNAVLESVLDLLAIQTAPISAKIPILLFMTLGLILGCTLLYMAFYGEKHWQKEKNISDI